MYIRMRLGRGQIVSEEHCTNTWMRLGRGQIAHEVHYMYTRTRWCARGAAELRLRRMR